VGWSPNPDEGTDTVEGKYVLCGADRTFSILQRRPELEFLKSLWGLGTEEEEGYRTGPPGYRLAEFIP
jgi:hypothetical protein